MIDEELLNILACPACKADVKLEDEKIVLLLLLILKPKPKSLSVRFIFILCSAHPLLLLFCVFPLANQTPAQR